MLDWPATHAGWFGLVGSLLLLVPVIRDQIIRRIVHYHRVRGQWRSGGLHTPVAEGHALKASGWHPADSASIFLGGVCLALSYTVTS
jgi:hypothetical protein